MWHQKGYKRSYSTYSTLRHVYDCDCDCDCEVEQTARKNRNGRMGQIWTSLVVSSSSSILGLLFSFLWEPPLLALGECSSIEILPRVHILAIFGMVRVRIL